jgi:homoserine kinase
MLQHATVKVPASTSNLGGGFDTLGLAVRRYLTARYEPAGGELVLLRAGTLTDLDVPADEDLLRRAFLAELSRRGVEAPGGALHVSSEVPVGRGLGTSAAAVVGGMLLAAAAAGEPEPDRGLLLNRAAELEGHADNAAPALYGGLTAVSPSAAGGVRALRFDLSPDLTFVYAAPGARMSTAEARRVLPPEYLRGTAVAALGRLAALLHGLALGDAESLAAGFADDLHVPYRLPLIQGGAGALDAAREAGAWGATISGSGSGLIAVCPQVRLQVVGSAMAGALRRAGHEEVVFFPLVPDFAGAAATAEGDSRTGRLSGDER